MTHLVWEDEPNLKLTPKDFDVFLLWASHQNVSDILLQTGEPLGVIRNNQTLTVGKRDIPNHEVAEILREIDQQTSENMIRGGDDRDFQYCVIAEDDLNNACRFRGCATGIYSDGQQGIEVVLRTIPSIPPTVEMLGVEEEIVNACESEYGLILVTGPTGSGKSTLNAALLSHIATNFRKHILTYEQPIEFDLTNIPGRQSRIAQTDIGKQLPDFPRAIKNALRRKPNIILIGEARDKETIDGCIRASLTGHLVLSTVHTNSVEGTISRLVDEFPPEERKAMTAKIIDSLRLIVHQRLVNKVGGGQVAIKSFLRFTEDLRRHLLAVLSDPKTVDIRPAIRAILESHGQPLMWDIEAKYREGLISETTYDALRMEVGTEDPIDDGGEA